METLHLFWLNSPILLTCMMYVKVTLFLHFRGMGSVNCGFETKPKREIPYNIPTLPILGNVNKMAMKIHWEVIKSEDWKIAEKGIALLFVYTVLL